jgi:hypothetical protein
MVHVLRARIRNTRSISITLGVNEEGKGQNVLRTVDVGHDGLPVYTIFSKKDCACAGRTLATIVRHLDKERGTPTSCISVLISSSMFKELKVLPELAATFYEQLRDFYRGEQECGQQNSLVPLPMFLFDSNVCDKADLTEAKSKWDAWRKDLHGHFSAIKPSPTGHFDRQDVWTNAVEFLTADRLAKDPPVGGDRNPSPKSPACEKVRSILLHIVWKCILGTSKAMNVGDLSRVLLETCDAEYRKAAQTVGTPLSSVDGVAVSDSVKQFEKFLGRYRYVTFADVSWIQGCEADVVVACLPVSSTLEPTILWPLLSRSKQLAIAVLFAENETEARRRWLGPWHDWDEEMRRHRANNNNP